MEIDEFIKELETKFWNKGTFFKPTNAMRDAVMDTIKSLLLKKNLVLISKSELTQLKYKAGLND